jgi:hypothetical protein
MRAARYDPVVEPHGELRRAFALWRPAPSLVEAMNVQVDDRVYLDGLPQRVAEVRNTIGVDGRLFTDLIFGHGLWDDPHLRVFSEEKVQPAERAVPLTAEALASFGDAIATLPTSIEDGAILLMLSSGEAQDMGDKYMGAWPWHMYVSTSDLGTFRMLEGTLTVLEPML